MDPCAWQLHHCLRISSKVREEKTNPLHQHLDQKLITFSYIPLRTGQKALVKCKGGGVENVIIVWAPAATQQLYFDEQLAVSVILT